MRGSAARLRGQRRSGRLLMIRSSPSSMYQVTAWWGAPSGPTVAIVAKRGVSRNARASGVSVFVSSATDRWYARRPNWAACRRRQSAAAMLVGGGDSLAGGCPTDSTPATRLERRERPRLGGLDRRPADEVALTEIDPEGSQYRQVGPSLDALGEQSGT